MKCHANKDYPNLPRSGVCSAALVTFAPVTRIQQSTFQCSRYTSGVNSVLTLIPSPFCSKGLSSASQRQLAFSPQKGIKKNPLLKGKGHMPAHMYWFSGAGSSSRMGQIKPSPAPCHQQTLQKSWLLLPLPAPAVHHH